MNLSAIRNRITERVRLKPGALLDHPAQAWDHPKEQAAALSGVLRELGQVDTLKAYRSERAGGRLVCIDGHLRRSLDTELLWDVDVLDLSDAEADYMLAVFDPVGALKTADKAKLEALLSVVNSGEAAVQAMLADEAGRLVLATEQADEEAEAAELTRWDVPDAIFATDNDWGVPLLQADMAATALIAPVMAWGASKGGRKLFNPGIWHFYVEDYRFQALWDDPSPVVNSGCSAIVEPNFSLFTEMAPAIALYRTYQKRWLARFWQSLGIRVFVDLNVAENHADVNLLGVPKGWKAWATRGYTERMDATVREYERAVAHAGTDSILFFVYGGGQKVKQMCQERGWTWLMEQRDAAKGVNDG